MCLAVPGEVRETFERDGIRFALVQFGGLEREICIEYQNDVTSGDYVLVHVGFAIAKIDREEAARTWALLRELGQEEEFVAGGSDDTTLPEESA